MLIKCLIVDDSPLAIDLLEDYISRVPFLKLSKKCSSAFEAMQALRYENIDLIFLDIQMPDVSGIDLMKSLEKKPHIIFTTAYSKYAVEGFNLDAVDFLLKPFSFERFLKSVNKAYSQIYPDLSEKHEKPGIPDERFIFLKSGYENVKINISEIQYIEGFKDYIKIHTNASSPVLTLMSLKTILEKLPPGEFIRIHKSYIVPINKITVYTTKEVVIGSTEIPIGDIYRLNFQKVIGERKM